MNYTGIIKIACFSLFVILSSCNGENKGEVVITSDGFSPAEIVVTKGTTVTWINRDEAIHTITSEYGTGSDELNKNDSYSHTFNNPGSFSYFCSIHPEMKGIVVVRE
jgi:plastocyanin